MQEKFKSIYIAILVNNFQYKTRRYVSLDDFSGDCNEHNHLCLFFERFNK